MTPAVNGTSTIPERRNALAFYGLSEAAFGPGAEAGWLWLGRTHAAVLAALRTAIRRGERVLLLTGDAGVGKSVVADRLGKMLAGEGFRVGKLQGPPLGAADLVSAVARACRIDGRCETEAALAERLLDTSTDRPRGSRALLIVDEAHRVEPEALVQLGSVSAMLPEGALSILLAGRTELNAILSMEENAALRHRVTARCTVDPLPPDEVGPYVEHRLRMAGATGTIFTPAAIDKIASLSRGAPGMINAVCGRALAAGHARHAQIIDGEIVEAALSIGAPASRSFAGADAKPAAAAPGSDRESRLAAAPAFWMRRGPLRRYGAAAIAALAIAAFYAMHAGWLTGTPSGPGQRASSVSPEPPRSANPVRDANAPAAVADARATGVPAASPDVTDRTERTDAVPGRDAQVQSRPESPASDGGPSQARMRERAATPRIESTPDSAVERSGRTPRAVAPAPDRERASADAIRARGLRAQTRPEAPSVDARPSQAPAQDSAGPAESKPGPGVQPVAPVRQPAPPASERERTPRDTPVRGERPQTRDSDRDASDGTAIIDWLLNESGRR